MNNKLIALPYNSSNPVLYDNDSHADMYTDELLLALSSAGRINLKGFITSSPENSHANRETYEYDFHGRCGIIEKARRSGMKNLPPHFRGAFVTLKKPKSGRIEDTAAFDTPGSRRIVSEAAKASRDCPLVLIMGGPATVAANAYLMDHSIADRMIVAFVGRTAGSSDDYKRIVNYNCRVDPWALYIVLSRLKVVIFSSPKGIPYVPKHRLAELPNSELRQWMMDKELPHEKLPGEYDIDAAPVISLLSRQYVRELKQVSFSHWFERSPGGSQFPVFKDDPEGRVYIAAGVCFDTATDLWWKAMKDPDAWSGLGPWKCPKQRPLFAAPFPVGKIKRIEAEDFDRGEDGVAYHIGMRNPGNSVYRDTNVRIEPVDDMPGGYNVGAGKGYCVADLKAGDWLEYTLDITASGVYHIAVRISVKGKGGAFRIEFDGLDAVGSVIVPESEGELWQTVTAGKVVMNESTKVMRFVVDSAGETDFTINVNYFEFNMQ